MARKSPQISLTEKEQQVLERRATSRTEAKRVIET